MASFYKTNTINRNKYIIQGYVDTTSIEDARTIYAQMHVNTIMHYVAEAKIYFVDILQPAGMTYDTAYDQILYKGSAAMYNGLPMYYSPPAPPDTTPSNNITVSGSSYIPGFHGIGSWGVQSTAYSRSTGKERDGKGSGSPSDQYGGCQMHWNPNSLYNSLVNQGLFPKTITSSSTIIHAEDINSLKHTINTILSGWTQTEGTKSYTISGNVYSSTNEYVSTTNVGDVADEDTVITSTIWSNILDRLNILDSAESINLDSSQIGAYYPSASIVISRADYNKMIKAIELVSKACKCNSDCACNVVCTCNADCGCNYSDRRLKENLIFLQYEHSLKIYQYNYINDKDTIYKGIMAQDLIGTKYEDALHLDTNGYYKVNYNKLPIKLIKLKK